MSYFDGHAMVAIGYQKGFLQMMWAAEHKWKKIVVSKATNYCVFVYRIVHRIPSDSLAWPDRFFSAQRLS